MPGAARSFFHRLARVRSRAPRRTAWAEVREKPFPHPGWGGDSAWHISSSRIVTGSPFGRTLELAILFFVFVVACFLRGIPQIHRDHYWKIRGTTGELQDTY